MDYATLKTAHVTAALFSYALFFVRGIWMIRESPLLQVRPVRIVPHVVDTILLASAIALAVTIRQYPGAVGWLTAKVAALVVYIVLGSVALKRGRTRELRIGMWVAAQATFFYIVAVAVTKRPWVFFA